MRSKVDDDHAADTFTHQSSTIFYVIFESFTHLLEFKEEKQRQIYLFWVGIHSNETLLGIYLRTLLQYYDVRYNVLRADIYIHII